MSKSILREEEYKHLSNLKLDGKILDVGGSKHSGYHELIKGEHQFIVINLDSSCRPDHFVDVEKRFPFDNNSFDHSVCLNLLEHVFEFETTFSEQVRCVRSGGKLVFAVPFMHHIHGSPDDYLRYTASAYRRLAEKYNCEIEVISPLGNGLFSLVFQTIYFSIPGDFLRNILKAVFVGIDVTLNKTFRKYKQLSSWIPLGYFVVMVKH